MKQRIKLSNIDDMYDLDEPEECRAFLKELRIGGPNGSNITHFDLVDGKRLALDDMTDSQAIQYGNEVYRAIVGQEAQ